MNKNKNNRQILSSDLVNTISLYHVHFLRNLQDLEKLIENLLVYKIKPINAKVQNYIIAHDKTNMKERVMQITGSRCKTENCTGIGGMEVRGEKAQE